MADRRTARRLARGPAALRLIGASKVASGLLLAAAGVGVFRLLDRDLGGFADRAVARLHLDPENRLVHAVVSRVAGVDRAHLRALGLGTFAYALLHAVEGVGLLLLKRWAEYLTVAATGLLLPLEVYEVARRPDGARVGMLLVNLAVLAFLVWRLRASREGSA